MTRSLYVLFLSVATIASACGPAEHEPAGQSVVSRPHAVSASWRPFSPGNVWSRRLRSDRREQALSSRALGVGHMGFADADYGIKFYDADPDDPTWTIQYGGYNDGDEYDENGSLQLRAPSGMRPPSGSDGTVILVDPAARYAYEMWRFERRGTSRAYAAYVVRVDLSSDGIVVGITGSRLPGIGGLLRSAELASGQPVRHKLWVAAHPDIVYDRDVWPARGNDAERDGRYASLRYGDVVALTKDYSFSSNPCGLSPFMQRLARILQDYGGIVQDKGGDALGFPTEVNGIRDNIDIDYDDEMWEQLRCLKAYMVRVSNPWD